MMQFLKLLLGFAPWIAFLVIAHGSMYRLKLGLAVAAALTLVMAVTRLHRGVIMWVGIAFFTYASVAVFAFEHMWTVRWMGVLANGALAAGAWITLAMGRPFTLEYAREHTDPAMWNHPAFVRTNTVITLVWAAVFTIGAGLAWLKGLGTSLPEWQIESANYSFMFAAVVFTNWYPLEMKRRSQACAQIQP
ncbi:MAG: hypothetical protein HY916_08915 [Desulfovibrio sp.]|jgi:hypothetical protein|nr:hypothetical protein [Desulfovibrio sp.]